MTRPTLVVDARHLRASGIGRYVRELVPRIARQGAFGRLVLAGATPDLSTWCDEVGVECAILDHDFPMYAARAQWAWRRVERAVGAGAQVQWFPHWDAPLLRGSSGAVVTVHDLIPLEEPGYTSPAKRLAMRVALRQLLGRARRVITVSDHTGAALASRWPTARSRVRVVPNGGGEFAAVTAGPVPALVRAPYLLSVANRKPHKNLVLAVEVLAALAPEFPGVTLVVAGAWFPPWRAVMARAGQLGVAERVIDVGTVSDASLRALYAGALALLAPSRAEGFGLPVVEAMACGLPVIAASHPWARALGGDTIQYAPVDEPAAWATVLGPWLRNDGLRREAGARGKARGASFTWEQAAQRTAAVLLEGVTG